jgi:hypothetical protein
MTNRFKNISSQTSRTDFLKYQTMLRKLRQRWKSFINQQMYQIILSLFVIVSERDMQ